jgi:hypothetical protein
LLLPVIMELATLYAILPEVFAVFLHSQRTLLYYYVYKLAVVSLSWKQIPALKHRALVREETSGFSLAFDKIRTYANNKHFHMRFPSVSTTLPALKCERKKSVKILPVQKNKVVREKCVPPRPRFSPTTLLCAMKIQRFIKLQDTL